MSTEVVWVYFGLLKVVLGAAIVQYPLLFMTYGVLPTLAMSVISALMAYAGLLLYVELNGAADKRVDVASLSDYTISHMRIVVNIVIFLKCWFVITLYIYILKDIIGGLPAHFPGVGDPRVPLFIILVLTCPLTFIPDMKSLHSASLFGTFAMILMILLSFYRFFTNIGSVANEVELMPQVKNWTSHLGIFVFGYTCHQSVLSFQNELRTTSVGTFKRVLFAVLCTSMAFYVTFGMLNAIVFGKQITGTILNLPINDVPGLFLKLFYTLAMVFTIPLQSSPCIYYGLSIVGKKYAASREYWALRCIVSSIILFVSYLIVCYNDDIKLLFNIIGGFFSSFINLIFPSIYYLTFRGLRKRGTYVALCFIVVLFAIFNIGCLVANQIPWEKLSWRYPVQESTA